MNRLFCIETKHVTMTGLDSITLLPNKDRISNFQFAKSISGCPVTCCAIQFSLPIAYYHIEEIVKGLFSRMTKLSHYRNIAILKHSSQLNLERQLLPLRGAFKAYALNLNSV